MKEIKFAKEQLLKSKQFYDKRDILSAVLKDGEEYTHAEAEELIEIYLEKEVK